MVAQVRYLLFGRSRGQVVPCVVCTVHVDMRSTRFLVESQNQGRRFVSGLAPNHWDSFQRFGLKTGGDGFTGLASKSAATVSWLSFKTKVVEGFPVWASKLASAVW
jgi:hypothetical protein